LAHCILLRLHDLQHNEALELAATIPDEKLRCRRLVPYWTAVFRSALLAGCESIPVLLLEKGLFLSPSDPVYPQDPKLGFPPPDYFITSCAFGLTKLASAMMKVGYNLISSFISLRQKAQVNKSWLGVTPLMYASAQGNPLLVQLLLENGANPYLSVPIKHLRVWRKAHLTARGTGLNSSLDPDRTNGPFSSCFNSEDLSESKIESYPVYSLDFAAGSQHPYVVQSLTCSMDDAYLRANKFSLLLQQNVNLSRILLSSGVNPNQVDGKGNAPIHLATLFDRLDLVELFLQHGADINQRGVNDSTALHLAVKFHRPGIALALVCLGADRQAKGCDGQTLEEFWALSGLDAATLSTYFAENDLDELI
ncbi:hypothetical protein L0F63_004327, partial [Massospora cicadina]